MQDKHPTSMTHHILRRKCHAGRASPPSFGVYTLPIEKFVIYSGDAFLGLSLTIPKDKAKITVPSERFTALEPWSTIIGQLDPMESKTDVQNVEATAQWSDKRIEAIELENESSWLWFMTYVMAELLREMD